MKKLIASLFVATFGYAAIAWNTPTEINTGAWTLNPINISVSRDGSNNQCAFYGIVADLYANVRRSSESNWDAAALSNVEGGTSIAPNAYSVVGSNTSPFMAEWSDQTNIFTRVINANRTLGSIITVANDAKGGGQVSPRTLSADQSGNFLMAWRNNSDNTAAKYFNGTSWGTEINLGSATNSINYSFMTSQGDGAGDFVVAWLDDSNRLVANFRSNGTFTGSTVVDTGLTVGENSVTSSVQIKQTNTNGIFALAYVKNNVVYASFKGAGTTNTWTTPLAVSNSSETIIQLRIALSSLGNGQIVWSNLNGDIQSRSYKASTHTLGDILTIGTGKGSLLSQLQVDNLGNYAIMYTGPSNQTIFTIVNDSTTGVWQSPLQLFSTNNDIADLSLSINPRSNTATAGFSDRTSSTITFYAISGTSQQQLGTASAGLFQKSFSADKKRRYR
ncbi:MAG: hypothetical protein P0S94_01260 [Simkaniaceae bacterium]|nr:hypothetical protein [Simkaniaceae bacterium]